MYGAFVLGLKTARVTIHAVVTVTDREKPGFILIRAN